VIGVLLVAGAVVVASALCSGTEAALLALPEMRARQLAESGGRRAKALLGLKLSMGRPIATIVVLNNIANIVGSMAVGVAATHAFGEAWLGAFSAALTIAIIIFAEIIPKTLGTRFAEPISLGLAGPLGVLATILSPLLWLLERVTRLFEGPPTASSVDEGRIQFLARQGRREGTIDADESEMIQRVFQLDDLTAQDIMTPRTAMTWSRARTPADELLVQFTTAQHSRIIIVGETLDDVVGVVLLRDVLLQWAKDGPQTIDESYAGLAAPRFVDPGVRADELLEQFLSRRQHLALVRDEYGQVLGVVTLEDVLEILTGEIVDETDRHVDLQAAARATAAEPAD